MKIPTILSEESVKTGATSPYASPEDFGAGVSAAGGQFAHAIGQTNQAIEQLAALKKEKQHLDDVTWAGTAIAQERNYIHKWMEDPENNTKETYADDLDALIKERTNIYSQSNKSPKAQAMFKNEFMSFGSSMYASAVAQSVKNRLTNASLSIDTQVGNVLDSYRHTQSTPGLDAAAEVTKGLTGVEANIDSVFGKHFPQLATKLKEKLATDAAYATMENDPDLAVKMLDRSKTLDEHTRHTIMDHIEEARRSKNVVEHQAFIEKVKDRIAMAKNGTNQDKFSLTDIQPYYPRSTALTHLSTINAQIDTFNKANDVMKTMSPLSADAQVAEVMKRQKDVKTDEDDNLYGDGGIVRQRVHQNVLLQTHDPVGYLMANNPNVKGVAVQAIQAEKDAAADPKNIALQTKARQFRSELSAMTLKYQGAAPKDAGMDQALKWYPVEGNSLGEWKAGEDSRLYLNKATNDRHLMSADEATAMAEQINKGSPKEMLKSIEQVMARYEDPEHQNIAFNDMVTMPKAGSGIKQEYQLAFLNKDAWWVDEYMGAVSNDKEMKAINSEKKADYDKALAKNPTWLQFTHSVLGDDFQRGSEVDGFRNGILTYSYARSNQKGEGPDKAVTAAVGKLISEELGFVNVNGQTISVAKKRKEPGQPYRTDDEIKYLGRYLERMLQDVDVREIKQTDEHGRSLFPTLQTAGTEITRMTAIREGLMAKGTYSASSDGQQVTLYYQGDDNHAFQVRDKRNRPFIIDIDTALQHRLDPLNGPWDGEIHPEMRNLPKHRMLDVGNWPVTSPLFKH